MAKKKVIAIGCDGIGPEVVDAACHILQGANFNLYLMRCYGGDEAISKGLEPFSEDVKKQIDDSDAVLFGSHIINGYPVLMHLRFTNDNYVNMRPVKYHEGMNSPLKDPTGIDFVFLRELSEGLYPGREGDLEDLARRLPDSVDRSGRKLTHFGTGKYAIKVISKKACERIAKFTCEFALQRLKAGYPGKVTCVTKSNLFLETDVLFEKTIEDEVKKHPELTYEHYLVDNMNRLMLLRPRDFDVIVAVNEYGDILTDAAAEIGGGLGLMGTGSFGGKVPYFESAHGAAPDIAGKNIANPTATVFASKYMLDYLGMKEEANTLEKAVAAVYKQGDSLTPDQGGTATTKELAEAILRNIR